MTFEELDKDLPNGFHDALVKKITLDFLDRSIIFEMELWVGDLNGPVPEKRRNGRLRLISPYFCQIEPPVPGYTFMPRKESVSIDSDSVKKGQSDTMDRVLRELPTGADIYRFFVDDWNSFIYFAVENVEFSWSQALEHKTISR
jgi:hypothetical protein